MAQEKILELSSRYYELVPRGAGTTEVARPIENDANLAKEFEQLLNLTEVGKPKLQFRKELCLTTMKLKMTKKHV